MKAGWSGQGWKKSVAFESDYMNLYEPSEDWMNLGEPGQGCRLLNEFQ